MKVKEYKIQMTFSIESEDADYEKVELFAQELADNLMVDHTLSYDDIEIVDANFEIQDLNDYNILDEDDEIDDDEIDERY